jgi:mannobiose 2-epimerase
MEKKTKKVFRSEVETELTGNIIPFWLKRTIDHQFGGFIGRMDHNGIVKEKAPKGLILNARILWTFSAIYQYDPRPEYLHIARRAFEYLTLKFQDTHYGGYYWMLSYRGEPIDIKKKLYGQAFMVYALSEFVRSTGDSMALNLAKALFQIIEKKAKDRKHRGYLESYNRDWTLAEDYRLSDKDMDEKKSMNTHLHLLEAYTNLYRVWKDESVHKALNILINVFMNHIINSNIHCFQLFFDEKWRPKTDCISFGHDIEGSWLLTEAVHELNDRYLIDLVAAESLQMVEATRSSGLDNDGGLFYKGSPRNILDDDKHWWTQAEAVVGFLNAYKLSANTTYLNTAYRCWQFIENYIVDKKHGEWFWSVSRKGKPDTNKDKISKWKGPYHNVRACLEILKRLDSINL